MQLFTLLVFIALIATIVSLALGIFSMMRGGEFDQAHSTQYMGARVGFQALAVVLLMLALYFSGK